MQFNSALLTCWKDGDDWYRFREFVPGSAVALSARRTGGGYILYPTRRHRAAARFPAADERLDLVSLVIKELLP